MTSPQQDPHKDEGNAKHQNQKQEQEAAPPSSTPSNRKKFSIGAAIVAVLAAGGWFWWQHSHPPRDPNVVVLYGNVDLRQVSLAFNANERIARLDVDEGQRVRAGQVLGELDTRTLALRLDQARAQAEAQRQVLRRLQAGSRPEELAQARANTAAVQADADLARRQLERLQATWRESAGRAVSQQDLDNAAARARAAAAQLESARKAQQLVRTGARTEDIAQAEAQLNAAQADIALMERQLAEAKLTAPVDAVVRARLMEPGDMASPQRPVYTLAITDPKWVRAWIKEADLGRIQPGMAASIAIDSLPNQALPGRIGYISSVAEFTPKTVQTEELRTALVYEVRVLADDRADRLRMGMPATVRIDTARR
ncbi:HlyD family secretion protein [Pseudoduganella flava]|uniref:HlyD family efflux transporter periplasmic adaptor subunit n=1 Tax=Pseudoduganella flava TaxID=871742 RepID=A0A562Q392_9BURK|nr:HlyD family efflux transporter periplasmic adaptor subunit [Pseudoduganella flava]QGZ41254.1 HlyD family efflux transporter periplasmic adaptor subunit [Pseudoduganella flava]TWI51191.1 HlyD family secretion protein [Pseudoduganella flava]